MSTNQSIHHINTKIFVYQNQKTLLFVYQQNYYSFNRMTSIKLKWWFLKYILYDTIVYKIISKFILMSDNVTIKCCRKKLQEFNPINQSITLMFNRQNTISAPISINRHHRHHWHRFCSNNLKWTKWLSFQIYRISWIAYN